MSQTKAELIDGKGDVVFDTDTLAVDATNNRVGIGEAAPGTQVEVNGAEPYITIKNSTQEDTDGGRESRIIFEGEQSGGEISTLAQIEVSHDGAVDDEKGKIVISTNDGTDGTAPTARVTVDGDGNVGIGTNDPSQPLHVNGTLRTQRAGVTQMRLDQIVEGSGVTLLSTNTSNANNLPIIFSQQNDSTTNERMRIDAQGRVGIGTTPNTSTRLHVKSGANDSNPVLRLEAATNNNLDFRQTGSLYDIRVTAGDPLSFTIGSTERMRLHTSGLITTEGRNVNSTDVNFMIRNNAGGADVTFEASNASVPGISGPIRVSKNASTSRSINAAGTVNQNGNDYAEYFYKEGNFDVAKGDIVGINANGKLTNVYAQAVSYCVKSTDPGIVGGDNWFTEPRPLDVDGNEVDSSTTEYAEWMERLETARQAVDRIAFCGQVPVNVTNATPGQFIVPVETDDGGIGGIAKNQADLTFEEYMLAVGKVIAIEDDGRARIIIKIS